MKLLLLDNYDSFTFNLVQYFYELGADVVVYKNDELTLEQVSKIDFDGIVISPGPGTVESKKDFGICFDVILEFYKKVPILGVCLGHQGIAYAFGAKICQAKQIVHGSRSVISKVYKKSKLLKGLADKFEVMRYHSLIVDKSSLSNEFIVSSINELNEIMSFEHEKYKLFGVQFHPESIGTVDGKLILQNFLNLLN